MTRGFRARRIAVVGPEAGELDRLRSEYGSTFRRYVARQDETTLRAAYEIGRGAVVAGVSVLDLVQIHHAALLRELELRDGDDFSELADAASRFLTEVLSTVDMTQRGLLEAYGHPHVDTAQSSDEGDETAEP